MAAFCVKRTPRVFRNWFQAPLLPRPVLKVLSALAPVCVVLSYPEVLCSSFFFIFYFLIPNNYSWRNGKCSYGECHRRYSSASAGGLAQHLRRPPKRHFSFSNLRNPLFSFLFSLARHPFSGGANISRDMKQTRWSKNEKTEDCHHPEYGCFHKASHRMCFNWASAPLACYTRLKIIAQSNFQPDSPGVTKVNKCLERLPRKTYLVMCAV